MLDFSRWSSNEIKRLGSIIKGLPSDSTQGQWEHIAEQLGPDERGKRRTGVECLRAWKKKGIKEGKEKGKERRWTEEEDEQLKEAVEKYGENWSISSSFLFASPISC